MIEVTVSYNLAAGMDQQAYGELGKRMAESFVKAPGFVELRANRNLLGSPGVRVTCVWESLEYWSKVAETTGFQVLWDEMRTYITDAKVDMWAASPVMRDAIRPNT